MRPYHLPFGSAILACLFILAGCKSNLGSNMFGSDALPHSPTVTATAYNASIQSNTAPTNDVKSYAATAAPGYTLSQLVGGTCPPGNWTGGVYTTGTVSTDCSVVFQAFATATTLSQTAQFLSPLTSIPSPAPGGNVWYVDGVNGNDSNSGLTKSSAFQTISRAYLPWKNALFKGGDVVVILPATYTENIRICDEINNGPSNSGSCWSGTANYGGTAAYPTTFMAMPCPGGILPGATGCTRPKIIGGSTAVEAGGAVFQVWAAYVRISGFDITSSDTTSSSPITSCINGQGVTIVDGAGISRPVVHHVYVDNNVIHDCSGAGIVIVRSDYAFLQNNIVYNNAFWSSSDTSGISLAYFYDLDGDSTYHILIANNVVYNNLVKVPINFNRLGVPQSCPSNQPNCATDGNGIILDTQVTNPTYAGKALIFGNIVYNNGGRGLSLSGHGNVDVINNTFYFNGQPNAYTYQTSTYNPEILAGKLDNITPTNINILNNILAPLYQPSQNPALLYNPAITFVSQQPSIVLYLTSNVVIQHNVLSVNKYVPGASAPQTLDNTNLIGAPLFKAASTSPISADFHLQNDSPGIKSGLTLPFDVIDINWNKFYSPANANSNVGNNLLPNAGAYIQ